MYELGQETLTDSAIAIYIAIAPRDPRELNRDSEPLIEYLEPVAAEDLAQALLEMAIPAQIIDGAHIGAPGWVIARTVGVADGYAIRWAPEENTTRGEFPTIEFEDVAAQLAQRLDAACHIADHPNVPSTHAHLDGHVVDINQHSCALVGQYRSTDGPLLANVLNDDIWFRHGTPWTVAAPSSTEVLLDAVLGWNPSKPSILFERNGAWRRMTVMHREYVGVHEWGPQWSNVDPRLKISPEINAYLSTDEPDAAQFVFDYFDSPSIDALELKTELNLDGVQADRLELVFGAPEMDDPFTAVSRILGLPEEAAEVAEGWREASSLSDVREIRFEKFSKAVWSSVTSLPSEQDLSSRIIRLWLVRPYAYYALNAVEVAALGVLARAASKRGRRKTGALLGALAAVAVADFFVPKKWRGQPATQTNHSATPADETQQDSAQHTSGQNGASPRGSQID